MPPQRPSGSSRGTGRSSGRPSTPSRGGARASDRGAARGTGRGTGSSGGRSGGARSGDSRSAGPRSAGTRDGGSRGDAPRGYGARGTGSRGAGTRSTDGAARSGRSAGDDRGSRGDWRDRPARTERSEWRDRPARGERSERGEWRDRPARVERTERSERGERGDRPTWRDRPAQGERPARGEWRDRPAQGERPGRSEWRDRPARGDWRDRSDRPDGRGPGDRDTGRPDTGRRGPGDRESASRFGRGPSEGRPARRFGAADRSDRGARGARSERRGPGGFGDRSERSDRPTRSDRPVRRDGDGRFGRGPGEGRPVRRFGAGDRERPARGDWRDRPDRGERPARFEEEERPTRPVPRRADGSLGRPIGRPQRRPVERRELDEETLRERQAAAERVEEREVWVDEGPVRDAARGATRRARGADGGPARSRPSTRPVPREAPVRDRDTDEAERPLPKSVGVTAQRARTLNEKVEAAQGALERERFGDARRMVTAVIREAPDMASAQEVLGLAQYRLGNWRQAAVALETFRSLGGGVVHHPVLADCYRALRKYDRIDEIWEELKAASPSAALVAEGRIVVAGAHADQGDLEGAIELLRASDRVPAKVRDHHLRLWYVLADLYDRSGDVTRARALFARVLANDPEFADAADRLRQLGR